MADFVRLLKPLRGRQQMLSHGGASLFLALALGAATSGCALIFTGTTSSVPIDSEPQRAEVFVDGVPAGTTPLTVKLADSEDHVIVFKRAGHQDRR